MLRIACSAGMQRSSSGSEPMQDRYTGDIGDFVKYGLLRAIRGRKRLGVACYLHPDDGPDGNGRHVDYLRSARWRRLDPELFDCLKRLVDAGDRSVGAVQAAGALGRAAFAAEPLDIGRLPVRDRERWRREWFARVRSRLSDCDLVFADPDNGLFPDDRFAPARKESEKRMPIYEANALAAGRTAVFYHHNSRFAGGHAKEIRWWMGQLHGCTCAFYWRRWSNRTFFIVNADDEVERRLKRFVQRWGDHGQLLRRECDRIGTRDRPVAAVDSSVPAPDSPSVPRCDTLEADPVIEAYKRDVDRTLLRQNLRRSLTERVENLIALQRLAEEARRARQARERDR